MEIIKILGIILVIILLDVVVVTGFNNIMLIKLNPISIRKDSISSKCYLVAYNGGSVEISCKDITEVMITQRKENNNS